MTISRLHTQNCDAGCTCLCVTVTYQSPPPSLPSRCPFPGRAYSWLHVLPPIHPHLNLPAAFPPSSCSFAWVQASASTWLLNLSLSPLLKPTSEGKLNILQAVCWCLYLIKCTDEVLIYCRAVFTLYYKEITQLEWDQAGNTVSRFHNLIAKRKQEPGGGWRRVGWWVGGWVIIVEGWADTNTTTYKRRDLFLTLLPPW